MNYGQRYQFSNDSSFDVCCTLVLFEILFLASKTVSPLFSRSYDYSLAGFPEWTVLSVQFWGEDARGRWVLTASNDDEQNGSQTELRQWRLELFGTA